VFYVFVALDAICEGTYRYFAEEIAILISAKLWTALGHDLGLLDGHAHCLDAVAAR